MTEIRSECNINSNIPYIAVGAYIQGRPVRLGHILVKLKRGRPIKFCLFNDRA